MNQATQEVTARWDHLGGEGQLANEGEEFPLGRRPLNQPAFDDGGYFLRLGMFLLRGPDKGPYGRRSAGPIWP